MPLNDLVLEAVIAAEFGESKHTWRNRRLSGQGPPFYKLPGKRTSVYYSRTEALQYFARFRHVPARTARLIEEIPAA
jgi:hypothetical protein